MCYDFTRTVSHSNRNSSAVQVMCELQVCKNSGSNEVVEGKPIPQYHGDFRGSQSEAPVIHTRYSCGNSLPGCTYVAEINEVPCTSKGTWSGPSNGAFLWDAMEPSTKFVSNLKCHMSRVLCSAIPIREKVDSGQESKILTSPYIDLVAHCLIWVLEVFIS